LLFSRFVKPRPCSILAKCALTGRRRALIGPGGNRGFTLLELLIVVVLVSILVVMAVPSVAGLLRDRRANQAGHEVALIYRRARAMAMGRGGAVLVRFVKDPRGHIEVREALTSGGGGQCSTLPSTTCQQTNWDTNSPNNRLLASFDVTSMGAYNNVALHFYQGTNAGKGTTEETHADICYSPLGRAFIRMTNVGLNNFNPLTQVPTIEAEPVDKIGRTRTVLIVPTGVARLAL
jgi:prepilin-type N-terminal cleavage/methylation domain-containing protein